jgi:dihydrofolate reductase
VLLPKHLYCSEGFAMKRLRYQVAVSLDGFIAGPNGEYDWIVGDSSIDFGALFKEFDTAVMGRKTYEVMTAQGGDGTLAGLDVVVFSKSLPTRTANGIRITNEEASGVVKALKKQPGKDIWLFGGGALFRSLLDADLVDTVELALMPVMIGSGIPLLPPGALTKLELVDQKVLPASGIVFVSYRVRRRGARGARIRYIKPRRQEARSKRGGDTRATARKKSRATR